jgi:hypothetical protein
VKQVSKLNASVAFGLLRDGKNKRFRTKVKQAKKFGGIFKIVAKNSL